MKLLICFVCDKEFETNMGSIDNTRRAVCLDCCVFIYKLNKMELSDGIYNSVKRTDGCMFEYIRHKPNVDRAKAAYRKNNKCSGCKLLIPHSSKTECVKCFIDKLLETD
jgi:hypothetical protein